MVRDNKNIKRDLQSEVEEVQKSIQDNIRKKMIEQLADKYGNGNWKKCIDNITCFSS